MHKKTENKNRNAHVDHHSHTRVHFTQTITHRYPDANRQMANVVREIESVHQRFTHHSNHNYDLGCTQTHKTGKSMLCAYRSFSHSSCLLGNRTLPRISRDTQSVHHHHNTINKGACVSPQTQRQRVNASNCHVRPRAPQNARLLNLRPTVRQVTSVY